jgi:hypothetical protein
MSHWVDYDVDVLASSPSEMNFIEGRLKQPSQELADWGAQMSSEPVTEVAKALKELLDFKVVKNLGHVDEATNKTRRFSVCFKDRHQGIVRRHLLEVSDAFPTAVLLLGYGSLEGGYSGKQVIRSGEVVRDVFSDQMADGVDWALLDIFAPFRTEYFGGTTEFGGLWQPWLEAMMVAVRQLKNKQSTPSQGSAQIT